MKYIGIIVLLIIVVFSLISRGTSQYQLTTAGPTPLSKLVVTPTPLLLPQSVMLPKGTQVFQSFNNCGPASLSMALSHYGITINQQTLGKSLRPYQNNQGDNDDKSVTLTELATKAEEYGLKTYHRPAGSISLIKQFIAAGIPVVTRTWLHQGEDIGHFRVITGYDDMTGNIVQDDSFQGANIRFSYEEFDELWQAFNYEFLVLVPPEKEAIATHILGNLVDENASWRQAFTMTEGNSVYDHFNRAVALYHLGRFEESIEAFEQVQTQLPKRMLWYQIEPILAYYHLGEYDKVMSITQSILTSGNQAYSELHYLRGEIEKIRGDQEKANINFQSAALYNESTYWKVNI